MINSHLCRDLNPGRPRYQADMLPIELSYVNLITLFQVSFYVLLFPGILKDIKLIFQEVLCTKDYTCDVKCKNMRDCRKHACNKKCCDGITCKYSNHLNTGQVWYSNGPDMSGFQMVQFLNGVLKIGQKMSVL